MTDEQPLAPHFGRRARMRPHYYVAPPRYSKAAKHAGRSPALCWRCGQPWSAGIHLTPPPPHP